MELEAAILSEMLPTEPPRHAIAAEVVACQCAEAPEQPPSTDSIGPQFPYALGARVQYDYRLLARWSFGAVLGYEHVTNDGYDVPPERASVGELGAVAAYRTDGEPLRGGVRFAGGFAYADARDDHPPSWRTQSRWRTPGYFFDIDGEISGRVYGGLELFVDIGIFRMRNFYWGADGPRYGATWMYAMLIVPLSGSVGLRYLF